MSRKQEEIIKKQAEIIKSLQEQLKKAESDLAIKDMFCDEANATSKDFLEHLRMFQVIFDEEISKAKEAREKYEEALAEVRPLIKKYKRELHDLNASIKLENQLKRLPTKL
jgi:hypothetical protein